MPPKRVTRNSQPTQPATPDPVPPGPSRYDLRKTHIPRISPPPKGGYQGKKNTNGSYVPRAAATQAAAIRRRAAAARAARANSEAAVASPGPSQTRPRQSATPQARRSITPGKRVQFNLQDTEAAPSTRKKSNTSSKDRAPSRAPSTSTEPAPAEEESSEPSYDEEEADEENGRPTDGDNSGSEEEDSDDEDDNLPSIDDRDIDTEEERSAKALYDAKERYREVIGRRVLDETRRRYPEGVQKQPREVETSDLEGALEDVMRSANYLIGIVLNVRINKKPHAKKSLPDSTRRSFKMEEIEQALYRAIHPSIKEEEYEVISRRVTVKHSSGRGRVTHHDFDDFDTANGSHILSIIDKHHERHRSGIVEAHFDINVECDALLQTRKRTPRKIDDLPSSDMPSSPPLPPRKRQNRSNRLHEQHTARLDTIRLAGSFQKQLLDRWRCNSGNCTNKDNFCFPEPTEPSKHYNITAPQHEMWSNAIASGEATVQNPPVKLLRFWEQKQGPISRESRQTTRYSHAQHTRSSMEQMAEIQQQMREQMMEDRMFDQMEAMERNQERREERQERRRLEQEWRERKMARMRFPYSSHYPFPPYGQPVRPFAPFSSHYPNLQSPAALGNPQGSTPLSGTHRSSPIDETMDEFEVLETFFYWKNLHTPNPHQKEKWDQVREIVFRNDWTIQDLKDMANESHPMYQRAVKAGISDGFTRLLQRELQTFKQDTRHQKQSQEELQAVSALGQLGHPNEIEGGGFMPHTS